MKNSNLATRIAMIAVFLAVVIYFGFNVAAYFMDPYTTSVAYSFTSENAVTVSGYMVREEEVLPGGGELVYIGRGEGERVGAGGTVALVYQSAQALDSANMLRNLEMQLEQLQYAQTLVSGAQASSRLDDEIRSALLEFRADLADGSLSAADESGSALRGSVLKRSYAYSGGGDLDTTEAALKAQISSLSASVDPGTSRITAPKAGLFSSLVDGYEPVLHLDMISTMTPQLFRNITPVTGAAGVGKMVYGGTWAFVTAMHTADIGRLAVGDTITLRFQKGLNRDMEMKVSYISVEQGGEKVVAFTSEKYLSLTTLLRRQNAEVIFDSYSGVRVPRSSVRVEQVEVTGEDGEPELDSNGNPKTEAVTCVYAMWGRFARRKPVKVLWQEDEYILVVPDTDALNAIPSENTKESRRLRAGDEVIISAAEIYDGMVILE